MIDMRGLVLFGVLTGAAATAGAQEDPMISGDNRQIALPDHVEDAMGWSGGVIICPVGEDGERCTRFTTTYCCEGADDAELAASASRLKATLAAGAFVDAPRIPLHTVLPTATRDGEDEFAARPVRVRRATVRRTRGDLTIRISGQRRIRISAWRKKRRILSGSFRCEEGPGAIAEVILSESDRPVLYGRVVCPSGSYWTLLRGVF